MFHFRATFRFNKLLLGILISPTNKNKINLGRVYTKLIPVPLKQMSDGNDIGYVSYILRVVSVVNNKAQCVEAGFHLIKTPKKDRAYIKVFYLIKFINFYTKMV